MWRFKPSKFKNAVPKTPRNKEEWITDVPIGSLPSFGNHIKASAAAVAFNVELEGQGNLGVVSLNDFGNKPKQVPVLHAHSGFVTDFDFCPYDDYILSTASEDCHVKLWRMAEDCKPPSNPEVDILLPHRVENVKFHPQADCILSLSESNSLQLWDINTSQCLYSNSEHSSVVQSISWRYSGDVMASNGQDKKLRIWDPRDSSKSQVIDSHYSDRDSRVIWLGDSDQLLTTGLGSERQREVFLRDLRNLVEPVATYSGDTSLKAYIPLYDPDTNMLFLIAQVDHAVMFCEILEYAPFIQEATKHLCDVQVFGGAMIPKRALSLMDAEVNRLLLLGKNCVLPLSFQIPRKSYRNFHEDLFPDTYAPEPSLTVSDWKEGKKAQVQKMKLNPNGACMLKANHCLGTGSGDGLKTSKNNSSANLNEKSASTIDQTVQGEKILKEKPKLAEKPRLPPKSEAVQNKVNTESKLADTSNNNKENADTGPPQNNRRSVYSFGIRQSKFRHLNGLISPKETHITDLVSLTRTMPGECDCFAANEKRIAVPIGAGGTFLAVLELSKPGRVPAIADMPGIVSGVSTMDFCWDPFDSNRLAIGCENGILQLWMIPDNLSEKLEEPDFTLRGHSERITCVKFHPSARDIIATASSDLSICIWDLCSREMKYRLIGSTDQILCISWSPDGKFIASVSKDQKVRLFNARESSEPVQEGSGPKGLRGARAVWVLDGTFLAVSGFSKVSERQVYLYCSKDITEPVEDISLDVSPATLIPYYDEDSSTLFLSGKGDAIIFAYEVSAESPHFHPLSHYKCPNPHQALSFLPKHLCDVRKVEFAKAIRLTTSTIELISFSVPRTRMEYFQDDLFPPALNTWTPVMTSSEWLSGMNKLLERVDLKPADMTPLSEAPPPVKAEKLVETPVGLMFEGEVTFESSLAFLQNSKEKEERLVQAMKSQCELQESELPQEEFEGVDPSEWDD